MNLIDLRRAAAGAAIAGALQISAGAWGYQLPPAGGRRPNVVMIVTDDQGYGDLGVHGNARIHTPHLDRLAREGVRLDRFYVSPVCSPTRASLLTGRYNYRTGVVDTYLGRSLMHGDETTLAEVLGSAGYRTGIFGKWHLGDNYPLRAMDQGFQEALTLNGGGIGQPSDPPGGESYFDPTLRRNGEWVKLKGYVSDVITDAGVAFIERHRNRPFFAYLAFNAPHTPLQAPPALVTKYRAMQLTPALFTAPGHPVQQGFDAETTAKIYAMVENIDENVGRVLAALERMALAEDTILIFLTDNGPQQPRYNAGLLRLKGTVHEGGIRVPFFVRWPRALRGGRTLHDVAAHIDVMPTILDSCGVRPPAGVRFDGVSLLPLLRDGRSQLADRTLFLQWHRGDTPQEGRAFTARTGRFKLVQPLGNGEKPPPPGAPLLLFDMQADPLEERDIAAADPSIVAGLRRDYGRWFLDVTGGRDYTDEGIARIAIGAAQENPVRLTRQDWRGPHAGWTPDSLGHWMVDVRRAGRYEARVRVAPFTAPGKVTLAIGRLTRTTDVRSGDAAVTIRDLRLTAGPARLAVEAVQPGRRAGAVDVVLERR